MALLLAGAAHAAPPAGSPIDNVASATAVDGNGAPVGLASNTVRTVVQGVERVTLRPDRGGLGAPGTSVTLAHRLVNAGNLATDFRLDATNLPFDGFDPASFALTHDRDRDGAAGAGDTPVANGGVVTLAAGDSADVLLTLGIPAGAPMGALALVRLGATGMSQGAFAAVTDTLRTPNVGMLPALMFCDAPDYQRITRLAALAAPLHVQAIARGCDLDPLRIERVNLTLRSRLTGDRETYSAVETAPHSGLFRILPGAPTLTGIGVSAAGDGQLAMVRGDLVTAELEGCGRALTTASVWVEPRCVVYDSRTDATVGGVRVRLIDVSGAGNGGVPGGPAAVYAGDGVTPSPADVVTDPLGRFSFPLVRQSTYRLEVQAPEPWRFPSQMGAGALPPGHFTDPLGSYGGSFTPADSLAPNAVDLPVDALGPIALFVEHVASRPEVEWGDELEYRIRIANRSDSALTALTLHETLPAGFGYRRGSARGGVVAPGSTARPTGTPVADAGSAGPMLAFDLGALAPQETYELVLRVRVRAGAPTGEAIAVAQATARAAASDVTSNAAPARVRVRGDLFADEGAILGAVNVLAADGTVASGLAGVRLYLDDGTWAVTDQHGRYSFTGVTPRTHALKLDRTTLPPRAVPVALDRRDAGTPGLRFVDLTRGELARADFAVTGDTTTMREAQDRRLAAAGRDETARALARGVTRPEQRLVQSDPRALPASAIATGEREAGVGRPAVPVASVPAAAPHVVASLEQLLPTLDPELGFVGLADLDTVATTQLAVRVKGRLGTPLALRVNGARVPESRVGRRVSAPRTGLEAWEYVGVELNPGVNVLELSPPQARGRVVVRVVAPAGLAGIVLAAPVLAPADGRSAALLTLAVVDSAGVPVGARTLVTLESTLGRIAVRDLDPVLPGVQMAVEGGSAEVPLIAPAAPGRARITARTGAIVTAAQVEFVPEMRPLLAVGALEGVVTLQGVRRPAHGTLARTGFEQPIGEFLAESRDGRNSAGARGALFVKGRVRDDVQLTLGYDSDRPEDLRQFRDLQVDRGYPIHGDAAVRGYDAQSTGRFYARVDRRDASLLYGDLTTGGAGVPTGVQPSLANYVRSLTGAAASWGGEERGGRAFTSRQRSRRIVDEIPGRGVSGPYQLGRAPIVENSERVEVQVRDRDQPAVVVSSELRQRFTDYELDPLSGRLLFRAPVPSLDPAMNPVIVRVTYEIAEGGPAAWVHGAEVHGRVGPRLQLGGTYVDDHDPAQPFELRGATARVSLAPRTSLEGEWAATRFRGAPAAGGSGLAPAGAGDAGRAELKHEGPNLQARVWGMTAADGFQNPSAGLAAGRSEAGGRLVTRLAERTRFSAEAQFSADAGGKTKRGGILASLDRTLSPAWRGELGVRVAGGSRGAPGAAGSGAEEPLLTSVRLKLNGQWPRRPEWSGYGEFEQDTRLTDRRLAALGGEYRFSTRGRAYARHELASSLHGPWSMNSGERRLATVAGIDAALAHDAHVFSEYRLADAFAGRDAQAAVGLRNAWRLASGMRVGGGFERVNPLGGPRAAEGPSTAVSGSVDWTEDPRWKGSARMELRSSRAADQVLQTMAAAVKLDSSWVALGRHALTFGGSAAGTGREAREQLQVALAYRDPGGAPRRAGRWDALGRWEFLYERTPGMGQRLRRVANVLGMNGTGRFPRSYSANLAWAGKITRDEADGAASAGGAQWVHGRVLKDFGRVWDAGVSASMLMGRTSAERQFGLGAEIGRQLPAGTWLSLGFNRFGYRDDELTADEWTRTGGYLRIRARFDETLFRREEVRR